MLALVSCVSGFVFCDAKCFERGNANKRISQQLRGPCLHSILDVQLLNILLGGKKPTTYCSRASSRGFSC